MVGVGIALAGEGLEVTVPELIAVVDHPGFAAFALKMLVAGEVRNLTQRPTPWLGISDTKCAGRPARSSRWKSDTMKA
jgi:hypothetical protein